ncbi:hypothetical protein F8M41_006455 [Gigaspora margarita]|uniref:Transmembrane protein n=1 Tax=Gigaspora margarita TaxID=4874 RepID=A0A8H3X8F2_GIGMA|nr:hypothetical protein F8M41_006455 [Gigaspora margarita]
MSVINSTNSTNSISTTNHTLVNSNIINNTSANSTTFNTTLYDLTIFANQNKVALIGLAIPIEFAILMYLVCKCGNKDRRSFAYFYCFLLAYEFTFEVAFFINNSHTIESLYFPSLFSFAVPAFINYIVGLYILYKTSDKFYKMFFKSFICAIDIRLIQICNSQYTKYQDVVLWLSGINLLIEDIPQLVIQILYKTNTYGFEIIPFMSLILCSIVIVIGLLSHLYITIGKHKTQESVSKKLGRKDSKNERNSSDTINDVDEWGVPRY